MKKAPMPCSRNQNHDARKSSRKAAPALTTCPSSIRELKQYLNSDSFTLDRQIARAELKRIKTLNKRTTVARLRLKELRTSSPEDYRVTVVRLSRLSNLISQQRRQDNFSFPNLSKMLELILSDVKITPFNLTAKSGETFEAVPCSNRLQNNSATGQNNLRTNEPV